jgi:hypothetical protein
MMLLHILATFVVVCFIALEWFENSSFTYGWGDFFRSSIFTLAVGYILFLSWVR